MSEATHLLAREEYISLTTYQRSGRPISTPVWAALHDGHFYIYTPSRSGKVRRIRQNPHVEIAACDFSGNRHGPAMSGSARVLDTKADFCRAKCALTAKYGNKFRWFTIITFIGRVRRAGGAAVAVEIMLETA